MDSLKYNLDEDYLVEMYTNILISDMDSRTKNKCHVCFVEILKQLSKNDLEVLNRIYMMKHTSSIPFGKLNIVDSNNKPLKYELHNPVYIAKIDNYIIDNYNVFSKSIENLNRLGLIEINYTKYFTDKSIYDSLIQKVLPTCTSILNDLRRETLNLFVQNMLTKYKKQGKKISYTFPKMELMIPNPKIALLLQNLEENGKYEILEQVDYIYLPFYYFLKENYFEAIRKLSEKAQLYIYLPSIIRKNYHQLLDLKLKNILSTFQITGIVLQNLGDIFLLRAMKIPLENYEIVANDTLNVFQNETLNELRKIGFNRITASTEINKEDLLRLNPSHLEVIVYGRTKLMTTQYCFMGKTNCCSSCSSRFCRNKQYFLKDRLSYIFPIKPDAIETVTTIYNSKITSISIKELKANTFRISILEETIEETNKIIQKIKKGDKLEGKNYTNGNFTKEI